MTTTTLYSTDQPLGKLQETANQELGQYGQGAIVAAWACIVVGLFCIAASFAPGPNRSIAPVFLVLGLITVGVSVPFFTLNRNPQKLFLSVYENGVELRGSERPALYIAQQADAQQADINPSLQSSGIRNAPVSEARFVWSDVVAFHSSDSTPAGDYSSLFDYYIAYVSPIGYASGKALAKVADLGGIHAFSFLLRPPNGASEPVLVQWITITVRKDQTVPIGQLLQDKLGSLPAPPLPPGNTR